MEAASEATSFGCWGDAVSLAARGLAELDAIRSGGMDFALPLRIELERLVGISYMALGAMPTAEAHLRAAMQLLGCPFFDCAPDIAWASHRFLALLVLRREAGPPRYFSEISSAPEFDCTALANVMDPLIRTMDALPERGKQIEAVSFYSAFRSQNSTAQPRLHLLLTSACAATEVSVFSRDVKHLWQKCEPDDAIRGTVQRRRALSHAINAQFDSAEALLRESLNLCASSFDKLGQCACLNDLSWVLHVRGDFIGAVAQSHALAALVGSHCKSTALHRAALLGAFRTLVCIGEMDSAEKLLPAVTKELQDLRRRQYEPNSDLSYVGATLALFLARVGRFDEASLIIREVLIPLDNPRSSRF